MDGVGTIHRLDNMKLTAARTQEPECTLQISILSISIFHQGANGWNFFVDHLRPGPNLKLIIWIQNQVHLLDMCILAIFLVVSMKCSMMMRS